MGEGRLSHLGCFSLGAVSLSLLLVGFSLGLQLLGFLLGSETEGTTVRLGQPLCEMGEEVVHVAVAVVDLTEGVFDAAPLASTGLLDHVDHDLVGDAVCDPLRVGHVKRLRRDALLFEEHVEVGRCGLGCLLALAGEHGLVSLIPDRGLAHLLGHGFYQGLLQGEIVRSGACGFDGECGHEISPVTPVEA